MADPLVRPIEVVRASDPALAFTPSERVAYAKSRDPKSIRELPGQTAVRFIVRPLGSSEGDTIERQPVGSQVTMAFVFGCVEIRDANELGPCVGAFLVPSQKIEGRDQPIWSKKQLDAIQETFGRSVMIEVGIVAYERMHRGKAAGGSVPYTVPQSLLDELPSMEARHRAEQEAIERAKTSSG